MNKKGFTLIELLAVFAILAILLTIAITSVTSIISNSKESLHDEQTKQIENAARMWYLESDIDLISGGSCSISISDIVNEGYIEGNDVVDPKTGETMTGYVEIKFKNNQYTYTYKAESDLSSCNSSIGSTVLFDPIEDKICKSGNTCFNWYVIDENDSELTLLSTDDSLETNMLITVDSIDAYYKNGFNLSDVLSGSKYNFTTISVDELKSLMSPNENCKNDDSELVCQFSTSSNSLFYALADSNKYYETRTVSGSDSTLTASFFKIVNSGSNDSNYSFTVTITEKLWDDAVNEFYNNNYSGYSVVPVIVISKDKIK